MNGKVTKKRITELQHLLQMAKDQYAFDMEIGRPNGYTSYIHSYQELQKAQRELDTAIVIRTHQMKGANTPLKTVMPSFPITR